MTEQHSIELELGRTEVIFEKYEVYEIECNELSHNNGLSPSQPIVENISE